MGVVTVIPDDRPFVRRFQRTPPKTGTYIVDPQLKVVSKYFEEDFRERVSISDILASRYGERVDSANTAVEAKHVRLSKAAYFGWKTIPWRAATGRFTTLHRAKAATTAELQICRTRG